MQNLKKSNHSIKGWVAFMRWMCFVLMLSVMMPAWATSLSDNFFRESYKWWNSLWESSTTEAEAQNTMMTKAGGIAMSLLENQQQLLAGKKQLSLGWIGGEAPYMVNVLGPDIARNDQADKNFITLPINLKVGEYAVKVTDKRGNDVQGEFIVVYSLPSSLESKMGIKKNPESEEEKLSWAMGLFASGWNFEAYQWVVNINRNKIKNSSRVWRTKLALETGVSFPQ